MQRELLDRTLVWNQAYLRRILRAYEIHHNQHRPHRFLDAAAPPKPYPNRWISTGTASGGRLTPVVLSTNTAWSHNVDEVFGTHRLVGTCYQGPDITGKTVKIELQSSSLESAYRVRKGSYRRCSGVGIIDPI